MPIKYVFFNREYLIQYLIREYYVHFNQRFYKEIYKTQAKLM